MNERQRMTREQHEGSDIDIMVDLQGASPWDLYGFSEEVFERTGLKPVPQ